MSDTNTDTPIQPQKTSAMGNVKAMMVTLVVLAGLWFFLNYIVAPMVYGSRDSLQTTPTHVEDGRLKQLEARIAVLENKPATAPASVDLSPIESRLSALEQVATQAGTETATASAPPLALAELEVIRAEIAEIKKTHQARLQELLLRGQLRDALRDGRPFADDLHALVTLHPELQELLAPVRESAHLGIPTRENLQEEFAQAIQPALNPRRANSSFVENMKSLVTIRKVGEAHAGPDDESVIARAEAHLAKGEVADALKAIQTLSDSAAEPFAAWRAHAEAYLRAEALLPALTRQDIAP